MDSFDWDAIRSFVAVARHGSLTAAAKALGASQPTLSRHVRALEEAVGGPLFVRFARGVRLTERGRALADEAAHVEEAMVRLSRAVSGTRERLAGTVRVAASEIVGVEVVAPALPTLRARHPGLEVELVLDNSPADLLTGQADLAVRLFRPAQADLVARLVGTVPLALYGHRDYLARHGTPTTVDDLLAHTLIGFDPRGPMARAMETVEPRLTPDRFALRTDSLTAQLQAARAGFGLAVLQRPIAQRYPELVAVELAFSPFQVPLWLVTHRDLRTAAPIRAAFTWLEETLAAYAAAASSAEAGPCEPPAADLRS